MSRSQKLQQDVLEYLENNRPRFLSSDQGTGSDPSSFRTGRIACTVV